MAAVALSFETSALGQLVRIRLPLEPSSSIPEEGDKGCRGPPRLSALLQKLEQLQSSEAPFVAWVARSELVEVAVAKVAVAKVFKLLFTKQCELGVHIKDVKTNVDLQPMPQRELDSACRAAVLACLQQRGWWALNSTHALGASLLEHVDGAAHTVESVQMQACAQLPGTVTLLLKAEVVRFRHIAVRGAEAGGLPNLVQLDGQLQGSSCTVLPNFREGVLCGVVPAGPEELAQLRPFWASLGFPLPPEVPYLVSVRFDDDLDAPSFHYPPTCVLSSTGLDPVHSRLDSGPVQSLLARVRDDLAKTTFCFWGGSSLKLTGAKVWYPDGPPAALQAHQPQLQAPSPFITAGQLAAQKAATKVSTEDAAAAALALGPAIDISSFSCDSLEAEGGGRKADGSTDAPRPKKPHAHASAALITMFRRLEHENDSTATAAGAKRSPKPALAPRPAAARPLPTASKGAPMKPAFGPKKSTAPPKPVIKRAAANPAAAKPPKAAKPDKPKPIAGGTAAAGNSAAPAGPGIAVAPPHEQTVAALPAADAVAAAANPAAAPATAVAVAGPKKPPRPKVELVVEDVVKKVLSSNAAGKLGGLTIPELKCYLKSIKKPVGGKKAELEERVRQHLATEA